jgi:hypothetical protein
MYYISRLQGHKTSLVMTDAGTPGKRSRIRLTDHDTGKNTPTYSLVLRNSYD